MLFGSVRFLNYLKILKRGLKIFFEMLKKKRNYSSFKKSDQKITDFLVEVKIAFGIYLFIT